jgi:hypothetical protein
MWAISDQGVVAAGVPIGVITEADIARVAAGWRPTVWM